jgi:hypothetical protein
MSFNDMNDYVIGEIFSYLSILERERVKLVCQKWQSISEETRYLIKFLSLNVRDVNYKSIGKVQCIANQYVRVLEHVDFKDFLMICNKWPKMTKLILSNCTRVLIVDPNQFFTELIINNCGIISCHSKFNWSNIKHLELNNCKYVNVLDRLLERSNLSVLKLTNTNITNDVIEIISKKESLKTLRVSSKKITDNDIAKITTLPYLEDLNIDGCTSVTNVGISRISKCTRLKYFSANNISVTDKCIEFLYECKTLKSLSIIGNKITDEGCEMLISYPSLKILRVSLNDLITGNGEKWLLVKYGLHTFVKDLI